MKKNVLSVLLLLFAITLCTGGAWAEETATPGASPSEQEGTSRINQLSILHVATTDTTNSVQQALTDLGETFDYFSGSDWSGIDLNPYDVVIVGMDGGTVNAPSVQNAANFANNGGLLIIIGGTCYSNWANAVNTYLLLNNTGDYCWNISASPHLTVTDPGNPLSAGLPGSYDFVNSSAAYYQIRSLDPATDVAAVNGDVYDALFSKPLGAGSLVWFINSAYSPYWGNAADYDVLRTIIRNALGLQAQPDLIVSSLAAGIRTFGTPMIRGVFANYMVMNQGSADAVSSCLDFYLSRDAVIDPGDVYLGRENIPGLTAGNSYSGFKDFRRSFNNWQPASGTWHVIADSDACDDNEESDETNNQTSTVAGIVAK